MVAMVIGITGFVKQFCKTTILSTTHQTVCGNLMTPKPMHFEETLKPINKNFAKRE